MDGRMPKIAYWTGWLSPEKEAVSREVFALREHFNKSFIFGLSRYYSLKFSPRRRYLGCNVKLFPLFRVLSPLIERKFDLHHVFGSSSDWYFLSLVRSKPLVLTAALPGKWMRDFDYGRVSQLAVECARDERRFASLGISPLKIHKIYPGVKMPALREGEKADKRKGTWKLLWASTPHDRKDWAARRIDLVMDLMQMDPSLMLVVLGRKWPSEAMQEIGNIVKRRGLTERVEVIDRVFSDWADMYALADITVAPFQEGKSKPCPNSIVESMACAKPVLVSSQVGISDVVGESGAGGVFDLDAGAMKRALDAVRGDYGQYCQRARRCAEKHFTLERFIDQYAKLYGQVL